MNNSSSYSWQILTDLARLHCCSWSLTPNEGEWGIHQLDPPPHNRLLGPVFARGETSGLVAVEGQVLHHWGDIDRADMTFSVTKTYLAMVAGVAFDQGLIDNVDQSVFDTLLQHQRSTDGFTDSHNKAITWRHFLHFTSEWTGHCFGVPDQVDHFRTLDFQPVATSANKGERRRLSSPGTFWEYNDVRINQFSCALMRLFDQPLPEIFTQHIMKPLNASNEWVWHGYDNSWVTLANGNKAQSVPGGGHWGGGVVISARDQLLLAQLLLNGGQWHGKQLVSKRWVSDMLTPCELAPWYGFFTWLNTDRVVSKAASAQSYFCLGIGGQLVWHDPARALVAVFRWIDADYTESFIETCLTILDAK